MDSSEKKVLVIAHRGAYSEALENSMEGFKTAIELKVDYIEFDVHKTLDGIPVIIHDENTLRVTGYDGIVKNLTLKELRRLNLSNGEKIPTLQEVIQVAKGKIKLLCELKGKGTALNVVKILREKDMIDSTIIQSFYVEELLEVKNIEPNLKLGLIVPIMEEYLPEWAQRKNMIHEVLSFKFEYLITRFKNVNKKFINYSHQNNLKILVYPVNSKIITKRYINMGVDGLIVNNISQTKAILRQLKDIF